MSALPHSLFTTDALPEKDRFAAWREDMSVIFDGEKSPLNDPVPCHASFKLHHFGQSVIGDLKASTGRYLRTRRKLSRDGLATFNRNFRKAFDCTPGEARATMLGGNQVSAVCSPHPRRDEQILREHHQWFQAIGI